MDFKFKKKALSDEQLNHCYKAGESVGRFLGLSKLSEWLNNRGNKKPFFSLLLLCLLFLLLFIIGIFQKPTPPPPPDPPVIPKSEDINTKTIPEMILDSLEILAQKDSLTTEDSIYLYKVSPFIERLKDEIE